MHPPFSRSIQLLKGHYPPGSTILHFSGGQASNSQCCPSLVREHFSRITAPRIFPIFCMNVQYNKGKKRTRRFVREKSGSFNNHDTVPKTAIFQLWGTFSGKLPTRFFSFSAWRFSTIRVRNVPSGMSGKNLDHSKFYDIRPKTAIFQLWSDFDGNLAQRLLLFMA